MLDAIAIQGEEGSNSAAAARELCGASPRLHCCASFREVFESIASDKVRAAVLPCENTTAGIVQEVFDRLADSGLTVRAEAKLPIRFVAAGLPGARAEVRRILCHPVAASQCDRFLSASGWQVAPCHDTAGAARLVAEGRDPAVAALCPPTAATRYALEVFAADVADEPVNFTRFLLVTVPGGDVPGRGAPNRALVSFIAQDQPGALLRALTPFATRGLNLCALHSRALPGRPGEYRFLIEIEAGAEDARCADALRELASVTRTQRVLGSYHAPAWPSP